MYLDEKSGMRMLRLDLAATAPVLYISLRDLALLIATDVDVAEAMDELPMGHA